MNQPIFFAFILIGVASVGYKLDSGYFSIEYNVFERLRNKKTSLAILGGTICVSCVLYRKLKKKRRQQTHNSEQLKKIQQLREQHEQILKKQIDEDINKFQQKKNQLLTELIQFISEVDYIKHKNSKQKIVVIGQISAGKSSILNLVLGVNLQCGVGETTFKFSGIYENSNAQVYDTPGVNKQFDIFSTKVLNELFKMDTFIICYQNCLQEVNHIIRLLSAISTKSKQKIYLVRTQCDRFKDSDALTIDKQLQVDRIYLIKMKQNYPNFDYDYEILATSARENLSWKDNQKLQKILKKLK